MNINTKGIQPAFIFDNQDDDEPKSNPKTTTSPDQYKDVKQKMTIRQIEHKEPHEVGAAMANLDSLFHLDMNTEIVEESVSDFGIVESLVAGKIYSPWIGELLTKIKALSVSIKRKGRIEKVDIMHGRQKQQRGLTGWQDTFKTHEGGGDDDGRN